MKPYSYTTETLDAFTKLENTCPGTVALRYADFGMRNHEPILVMIDSAIRYAKAYRARFDQPIGDDYMARDEFASILKGIRAFLNFDGGVAMEAAANSGHFAHDSKDNGMIESLYWTACEIAGLDGETI